MRQQLIYINSKFVIEKLEGTVSAIWVSRLKSGVQDCCRFFFAQGSFLGAFQAENQLENLQSEYAKFDILFPAVPANFL